MKIEIKHIKGAKNEIYNDAVNIRKQVFVVEQKIDKHLEIDENENIASYIVVYADGLAVSTGRYRETKEGIKMERFATLPAFRGKGMGRIVLKEILKYILPLNKQIYLNSQDSATGFYLKNGFTISGEPFYEAGIKHYRMLYSEK